MSLRSPSTIDLLMQIGEERPYEHRWSEVATLLHSPSSKILAAASRRKKEKWRSRRRRRLEKKGRTKVAGRREEDEESNRLGVRF
ncbi:unnamed protein product [Linum trigynum]|uniref:Uncharacterized protein n=1 Tax=Linum trigynum TaxID=586398 RepID=A0AAV2EFC0_9ROSI